MSALGTASISARRLPTPSLYRTRGDTQLDGVPAHRFGVSELRDSAVEAGLDDVHVSGMNAFSGVAELTPLWWPGRMLARVKPDLSHLLELTFRKPAHPGRS